MTDRRPNRGRRRRRQEGSLKMYSSKFCNWTARGSKECGCLRTSVCPVDISANPRIRDSRIEPPGSAELNYRMPIMFSRRSHHWCVNCTVQHTFLLRISDPIDQIGTKGLYDANKYAPLCDQSINLNIRIELILSGFIYI